MLQKKEMQKLCYIYILAAGSLWGTIGFYFHYLSDFGLDRFQIMLLRIGIAAIFLGIYILLTNRQLFQDRLAGSLDVCRDRHLQFDVFQLLLFYLY